MNAQKLLFKYIGFAKDEQSSKLRLSFLNDCLFRFTQPTELNDPFESYPARQMAEFSIEDWEVARENCRKEFGVVLNDEIVEGLFLTTVGRRMGEKEFPGIWPGYDPTLKKGPIHSLTEYDDLKTRKVSEDLLNRLNATYGIFCLSETNQNPLMWAHYAAGHRGIVIGFDREHEFFKNDKYVFPVQYCDERVSITCVDGIIRIAGVRYEEDFDLPLKLFLRKHPEWGYEKEWRMIKALSECLMKDVANSKGLPIYLHRIPPTAIQTLICGARISSEDFRSICNKVFSDPKWSHLKIFRAKLNDKTFKLDFEEYRP